MKSQGAQVTAIVEAVTVGLETNGVTPITISGYTEPNQWEELKPGELDFQNL